MSKPFDSRKFLRSWKKKKSREEWLFAVAVVRVGLEREGNLDEEAERQIAEALEEFNLSKEELRDYMKRNRRDLLRFLDSNSPKAS